MDTVALLVQMGVSTQEIAIRCNVTQRTAQNWLAGKHRIPKDTQYLLDAMLLEARAEVLSEISSKINRIRQDTDAIERCFDMLKKTSLEGLTK